MTNTVARGIDLARACVEGKYTAATSEQRLAETVLDLAAENERLRERLRQVARTARAEPPINRAAAT